MAMKFFVIVFTAWWFASLQPLNAAPTHSDVRYSDKYDRSLLDVWAIKSDKPAPLVVYFHGGGFKNGDKSRIERSSFLRKYGPRGVAFASVNYPFVQHTDKDYFAILNHTSLAIRYLHKHAEKYNIDPERISVMGSSAGALISCYLGHAMKLPIRSVYAFQQPMGTPLLNVPFLRKDGPPILLYNSSSPKDRVHHPRNAQIIHDLCQKLGAHSEVYGSKASGLPPLPKGSELTDVVMDFFYKSWNIPSP